MSRFFHVLGIGVIHGTVAGVIVRGIRMGTAGGMMLVKLLGAVRTVEFMALAGNPEQGNGHKKDRE